MLQALINLFKPFKKETVKEETVRDDTIYLTSSAQIQETLPLVKLGPEPLPDTITLSAIEPESTVSVVEKKTKKKPAVIKAKPKTTATKNTRKKK